MLLNNIFNLYNLFTMTIKETLKKFKEMWWVREKKTTDDEYEYYKYIINWNNYYVFLTTEWYDNNDRDSKFISEKDLFNNEWFKKELKGISDYNPKYKIWDIVYFKKYSDFVIVQIAYIEVSERNQYYFVQWYSKGEDEILWLYK